jgi:acyl-CoA synthetase (AMP-forming)/AMP-acid ligase II
LSLKKITYGTEPIQQFILDEFSRRYPHIKLQQTYGLSELGILSSKSKASNSVWVKIGGRGYNYKVVKGILHIKAKSAMVGYLHTNEQFRGGWYNTGDLVEKKGGYMRFLGRQSEIINVGGEKVLPSEVEAVIQCIPNVSEVKVYGAPNNLMGEVVEAQVRLRKPEAGAYKRILKYCVEHLDRAVKVPVKVNIVHKDLHTRRFKGCRVK